MEDDVRDSSKHLPGHRDKHIYSSQTCCAGASGLWGETRRLNPIREQDWVSSEGHDTGSFAGIQWRAEVDVTLCLGMFQ